MKKINILKIFATSFGGSIVCVLMGLLSPTSLFPLLEGTASRIIIYILFGWVAGFSTHLYLIFYETIENNTLSQEKDKEAK